MDSGSVLNALIGLGMPALIAVINQSHWSPKLKGAVALVACAAVATLTEWVRGDVTWTDWQATAVVIFGTALVSYQTFWRPTLIAPTLEVLTTAGGSAAYAGRDTHT